MFTPNINNIKLFIYKIYFMARDSDKALTFSELKKEVGTNINIAPVISANTMPVIYSLFADNGIWMSPDIYSHTLFIIETDMSYQNDKDIVVRYKIKWESEGLEVRCILKFAGVVLANTAYKLTLSNELGSASSIRTYDILRRPYQKAALLIFRFGQADKVIQVY